MKDKKFKIYKSSAGSGKTFTLVSEFIRIILLNPGLFRNILAITFTNKAANEMKSRIIGSLVELSKPVSQWKTGNRKMIEPLIGHKGLDEESIRSKAQDALKMILHNYSDLSVTTIDSFMQRVIRTFTIDLNLPQNYEVDLELDLLRGRAVDRLIDMAGTNKDLTDFLVKFLELKTDNDKSWRIENDLNDIAKSLFTEDGLRHSKALQELNYSDFQQIYATLHQFTMAFEDSLQQIAQNALKLMASNHVEPEDFSFGRSGFPGYFIKLSQKRIADAHPPGKRVLDAVFEGAWCKKTQTTDIKNRVEALAPKLIAFYHEANTRLETQVQTYHTYLLLLKHLYPLAVLSSIEKIVNEIKEEERILPISEFNRIIAEVTMAEPVPYIYERLGEKFRHIMIDEFQDTSLLQWQNLLPLIDNGLAGNYLSLVVGDAKQAIYRWRNGDVDQFISLPNLSGLQTSVNLDREKNLIQHHQIIDLPVNWRSHKSIVEFNNRFFNFISNKLSDTYKPVYEKLDQKYNSEKPKGFVQIDFFEESEDLEKEMLERMPGLIHSLSLLNYARKDIAILCRTNKQASLVTNHLLENGIHVFSSESLLLGYSSKVSLLICFLRIIANPADQLAYVEAIALLHQQGAFGSKALQDVFDEAITPQEANPKKRIFSLSRFQELLQRYDINFSRSKLADLQLYDLADELIRTLSLSVHTDIYIQFFLDELHKVISRKSLSLKDLHEWWEEKGKKTSVVFPGTLDAVQVLTIHKSKGLEFPVVIFPFATEGQKYTINDTWVDVNDSHIEKLKTAYLPVKSLGNTIYAELKETEGNKSLLDMINLMYVAFTRAEEMLVVLTTLVDEKKQDKPSVPAFIREFITDTDPGFAFAGNKPYLYADSPEPVKTSKAHTPQLESYALAAGTVTQRWQKRVLTKTQTYRKQDTETVAAIGFGINVHHCLSLIRVIADVEKVINDMVLSGLCAAEEKEKLQKIVMQVVSHPLLEKFFNSSGQILSEPEVLMPGGEIFRPDRVLIGDQQVEVAEFKTGSPQAVHKTQLKHYMEIINSIYKKNITGFLVYAGEESCNVEVIN